ncbi:MAG: translational GTPase TypA [Gammaproteobacteria bacterium]|nr:translational GTPase TypA [Gammaproteobacteria bacterium]
MHSVERLRNIAIIAHVDHGKTTLVDQLLTQSGTMEMRGQQAERIMDSNDQEKERGITILAKNTAIHWKNYKINIVDTPGHADFGGEVERILSMVDSVLLLVDAVDGPMPQTRFVSQKALAMSLKPIVVVNKIDREGARPEWVVDQTFDLFDHLGATDEQMDFHTIYTSALQGYSGLTSDVRDGDMQPLFELIVNDVPSPTVDLEGSFQMQLSSLDYSSYVGIIGIGRIQRGTVKKNSPVVILHENNSRRGRILQIQGFLGLNRVEVEQASAGDIVCISGIEGLQISETLCDPEQPQALPPLTVDEPTVTMTFQVNQSPFAGREGKYLTSRQIRERLMLEQTHNVALRVEDTDDPDQFKVSGRGELHLSVLIETMRREGYELSVSRPQVIQKIIEGELCEPYELATIEVDEAHQGAMMEMMGERKADLQNLQSDGKGRVRLEYVVATRGLIGFQTDFLTKTSGSGIISHIFDHYGPVQRGISANRKNGVLISNVTGKVLGYALFNLQERGRLFASHGDEVYAGCIVGIHSRANDLVVNPTKAKQLTNIRAAGNDENIVLVPPIIMSLEQALEFIEDDELVEITPKQIRLRKKLLTESERKRAGRVEKV